MDKLKVGKKSGLRYFGYADIKSWKPCYDPVKFIGTTWRGTAVDILKLSTVPAPDRLWVVLRSEVCSERVMRLFAVWCARQVQHLMTDPRSIAAIDVAERFANGEATREELDAAYAAATNAANAAYAATYAAYADAANSYAATAAYNAVAYAANADAANADAAYAYNAVAYAAYADAANSYAANSYADAAYVEKARTAQIEKLIEMVIAEGKERVARKGGGK